MRSTTRRAAVSAALVLSGTLLLTACNDTTSNGTGGTGSTTQAAPTTAVGGQSSGGQSSGGQSSGGGASSGSGTGSAQGADCHNLVASQAVKDAVTKAYEAQSSRGHIVPRPHQFLYGQCHGTTYAATAFDLTPGAGYNDQVASQDDGSTRKYFALGADGSWTVIGSAGFPDTGGCLDKIPSALATLWGGCHPGQQ